MPPKVWTPERERDQRGISDNVQSDKCMKTTVQYNNILTMFSTGRLSSEVPYPFIYHFSRTGYPFRAESPRRGHYRESPGVAHTSTHVIRTWIRLLPNAEIKNKQNLFLLNTEEHHGHHWQSSRGTWLRTSQRMFYSCRSSEILTLVLPCFYWNRIKLCVVASFLHKKKINFLTKIYFL